MQGIADWSPRTFFWIWSTAGPMLDGIEDNLLFVGGIHPHPLPGPWAEQFQLDGKYMATRYDPDYEFSHWDGTGYRRTARFTKSVQTTSDDEVGFPPVPLDMPERLPGEWVEFINKYTAGGKLKKEKPALEATGTDGD
jgi:hypothetical protein